MRIGILDFTLRFFDLRLWAQRLLRLLIGAAITSRVCQLVFRVDLVVEPVIDFARADIVICVCAICPVLAIIIDRGQRYPVIEVAVIAAIAVGGIEDVVVAGVDLRKMPLVFRGMPGDDVDHGHE